MSEVKIIVGLVASIESWYMVTDVLCDVLTRRSTLVDAFGRAASRFGQHILLPIIKTVATMPVILVRSIIELVLSVFQIPVDIAWALVPGLSRIPVPNIASVIRNHAKGPHTDQ